METQFELSLDLYKVGSSAFDLGRQVVLETIKGLQISGSNYLTEAQLTAVFSRALIDPKFAGKFRLVIGPSDSRSLIGYLRLVLERGPGPTVRHAFERGNEAYFSTVVQLSLLCSVYNLRELSGALSSAFEELVQDPTDIPKEESIHGCLRCIREQTCNFVWETWFVPLQSQIEQALECSFSIVEKHAPPYAVLLGVLKAIPFVYRFPESYLLNVRSLRGCVSLVVWTHFLLGLSVEIKCNRKTIRFGQDSINIFIDCTPLDWTGGKPDVSLMKKTGGEHYIEWARSIDGQWDPRISPAYRHTVVGYGTKCLQNHVEKRGHGLDIDFQTSVKYICKLSYKKAQEYQQWGDQSIPDYCRSKQKILKTISILFPSFAVPHETFDRWIASEMDTWQWDTDRNTEPYINVDDDIYEIFWKIVMALSTISDLESCADASLSLDPNRTLASVKNLAPIDMKSAFYILAVLLIDSPQPSMERAAVVSAGGWSLVVSSFTEGDPSSLHPTIELIQGVPARAQERRRYVLDHESPFLFDPGLDDHPYLILSQGSRTDDESSDFTRPVPFGSHLRVNSTNYMIGNDGSSAWKLLKTIDFEIETYPNFRHEIKLGLRHMQDLYWNTRHLTRDLCNCTHALRLGDLIKPPSKTWFFDGLVGHITQPYDRGAYFGKAAVQASRAAVDANTAQTGDKGAESSDTVEIDPWELSTNPPRYPTGLAAKLGRGEQTPEQQFQNRETLNASLPHRDPECRVHMGLTADNAAARWLLLAQTQHRQALPGQGVKRVFDAWYLRHDGCCVDCAVRYIRERHKGDNVAYSHVGVIL